MPRPLSGIDAQPDKTVQRTLDTIRAIPQLDARISTHLVTESAAALYFKEVLSPDISITGVPTSFKPPRAKYKARKLEHFRPVQNLNEYDWVLHLDEETMMDAHVLRTCIEFIERRDYEAQKTAQGFILYNAQRYWDNWLLTAADNFRLADDFGHFQFQLKAFGYALDGFHGNFLLVNGEVENIVTWGTGSLVEDMVFGLSASLLIPVHFINSPNSLFLCNAISQKFLIRLRHTNMAFGQLHCPVLCESNHH